MASNVPSHRPPHRPDHHPAEEQLASYAAGEMAEAPSLVIATHLALCPACRRQAADYEALGGELLNELPGEPLAEGSLSQTLARLDATDARRADTKAAVPKVAGIAPRPASGEAFLLPQPLRDYMSQAWADKANWRKAMPGLRVLKLKAEGAKVWMMELQPGKPIPHHGHTGQEMVLVLSGGYHDGPTGYGPGDLHVSGPETIHEPITDPDGPCLCLVMVEGSLRPTSWLGRIVSGLMGF
jgi:putative transcriptional regulator